MTKGTIGNSDIKIKCSFHGAEFWVGIILTFLCLTGCILSNASMQASVILCGVFLLLAPSQFNFSSQVTHWIQIIWFLLAPFIVLYLSQMILNVGLSGLDFPRILLGALCAAILQILFLLLTKNMRSAVVLNFIAIMFLSTANYFVYTFRGSELMPYDLLAIGTAADVAGQYQYIIPSPMVYAWSVGCLYLLISYHISSHNFSVNKRTRGICILVELLMIGILGLCMDSIPKEDFRMNGSIRNGYLLNFVKHFRSISVSEPEGYSPEQIENYEQFYHTDTSVNNELPDIIVIMNESFGDLRAIGQLNTNKEVMPFFDSIQENTIHGYALASGIGGGTCNSEYQFLTGNQMGFFPSGSFPYQQYIKSKVYSMFVQMTYHGYSTFATHPCPAKNWMRDSVWPLLGADRCEFIDSYPQKQLLREMVSDQEMYEQIIHHFEEKTPGDALFLFGVSMQNHGGYEYIGEDFTSEIHLEAFSGNYPDAEQYLTLLNHSDQALEYLINYFDNVEDDVVIAFFGDHLPKLEEGFYEELHGGSFSTLEEQMLQYTVPFFVWANFDIDERDVGLTSLNFLSNYVYEAAGLPLPAYNRALKDIQSVIPAMNAYGYYSNEQGAFIPYEEAEGEEAEMLEMYRILQYNSLFDEENRSEVFFPIPTTETP